MMAWTEKLQKKWGLESRKQVWLVLCVFACTGFSVMFLKKPIFSFIGIERGGSVGETILYYLLILPVYQLLLLCWGAVFGQFPFFLNFARKSWGRIIPGLRPKKRN